MFRYLHFCISIHSSVLAQTARICNLRYSLCKYVVSISEDHLFMQLRQEQSVHNAHGISEHENISSRDPHHRLLNVELKKWTMASWARNSGETNHIFMSIEHNFYQYRAYHAITCTRIQEEEEGCDTYLSFELKLHSVLTIFINIVKIVLLLTQELKRRREL